MKFTINYLHTCENAFFSEDNKLSIIKIFDTITLQKIEKQEEVKEILAPINFSVALNFSGDFNNQSTEKISITDPEDKEIAYFLISEIKPKNDNKDSVSFVLNLQGLLIKSSGDYYLTIKDNKEEKVSESKKIISLKIID